MINLCIMYISKKNHLKQKHIGRNRRLILEVCTLVAVAKYIVFRLHDTRTRPVLQCKLAAWRRGVVFLDKIGTGLFC